MGTRLISETIKCWAASHHRFLFEKVDFIAVARLSIFTANPQLIVKIPVIGRDFVCLIIDECHIRCIETLCSMDTSFIRGFVLDGCL